MIRHASRRQVFGAALAAVAAPRAGAATTPVPEAAVLLAPGPEDGFAADLARSAAAGLARAMPRAAALRVAVLGGPDGVTAANRFATISPQEAQVLLLLPGAAAQAWLVGDGRARYEPRTWPAVCGGLVPAVLAARSPPPGNAAPLRVAIPGAMAAEAAAILALDLIGRRAVPVLPPAGVSPEALVAAGVADALVLTGIDAPLRAAALGLEPRFAFDVAGQPRDPALPEVPGLAERLTDPANPVLLEAVRAAGAALRTRGLLVLPALTAADSVALWRGAARRWVEEDRDSAGPGLRRIANGDAAAALSALCPPPEVALAYREWLLRRFGWRAG
jgi:hypothetical protein